MGGRRGNGEGSVFHRKDGLWQADVTLDAGKRKSVYAKTRKEAFEKKNKLLRDIQQGLPVVSEKQTLGQYLTEWLVASTAHLRPRSYVRYEVAVRKHIVPTLGKLKLAKLTAQQIEAMYAAKRQEGLTPGTIARMHATLHKALADAARHELVTRNVASLARAPRQEHKEMAYWTPEQAATFLRALHDADDLLEAFYVLALMTGMRRGEILALH